ncbi:MAG TPA: 4Fe-4S binding protein [Armatimonadetes bacterium]|nr:4Fe-4S binding protein [Armatimonadota bacterium]
MRTELDLLQFRPLKWLLGKRLFPICVQLLVLAFLVTIIVLCWSGGKAPKGVEPGVFRYLNLGNFLVWVIFWPAVVIVAVLLGRLWCTVCPVELLTSASAAVGLKRCFPKVLRNISLMVLGYLVVRASITTFGINQIPRLTGLYLLSLVGVAVLLGFVFERRAFCSFVCPVGAMLGLYAKCAILELRTKDRDICLRCKGKPCLTSRSRLFGRACPNFLSPPGLSDNAECILCFQCVQACPNDNFRLSLRPPLKDLISGEPLDIWWALFLVPLYGNVLHELGEEWGATEALAFRPGEVLAEALGLSGRWEGPLVSLWLYLVLPSFVLLLPSMIARLSGSRRGFWDFFRTYSPALIPAIAGGHVVKAVFKMIQRGGFLRLALSDPLGVVTATKMASEVLSPPPLLLPLPIVGAIGLSVVLASWLAALWVAERIGARQGMKAAERASIQVGIALIELHALAVVTSWLVER